MALQSKGFFHFKYILITHISYSYQHVHFYYMLTILKFIPCSYSYFLNLVMGQVNWLIVGENKEKKTKHIIWEVPYSINRNNKLQSQAKLWPLLKPILGKNQCEVGICLKIIIVEFGYLKIKNSKNHSGLVFLIFRRLQESSEFGS